MLAFVDESKRVVGGEKTISIGFFVTNSFQAAYGCLINGYRGILRKYSIKLRDREIKFSTLLHCLATRIGVLSERDINLIFRPIVHKLSSFGYSIAFVSNQYIEFNIIPVVGECLNILKTPRTLRKIRKRVGNMGFRPSKRILSLFSMLLLVHKTHGVGRLIIDKGFIDKKSLSFMREAIDMLKLNLNISICRPEQEKGITLADFVSGYSRYADPTKIHLHTNDILIFRKTS